MNWNELTITASTRCGNETTPISNLNVCFVLYDPSIETYYYFDRQTNSSGVAVLEGSSTLLTSSGLGVRTQTLSERECGSCFGSEKENSRYSTTTIQGSGFVASSNPSYWFVESEFEGNGFSSEMYNLSQTSGELIYETDANGERAIMASTTIKISVTNSTIPSIVYSYWIYDSNLTTIKKDVISSGSTLVIDNIPQDASKYIIHAFAEDGRFREYIDTTKIQITAGTENAKSITLTSTGGDGYKFFINRLTCSDTLFNYIGTTYLVYPVQMYIENSSNVIVYSNLIEGSYSSTDISGYCGTRYIRFAVSGATSAVRNNYSSSITEYDLFGYIGGNINVDLLIPRKNYEIELPPVYDTVEFNPNIEARPSYSLPNTTIDTIFRAWDGSELCYDYNFQTASTYDSTSITITNSSISSNTLNKNWFYRCLAGKNISYNSAVNLDLSKNHYYDAHYTFVVSSYPVTNLAYTSNTKDYLYMCKSTVGNGGDLVPNYEPLFAFTINRENDVVFTRNEINDYVKGFAYVYTGNRGSKDIALINQIYGTDYTEESGRERGITAGPNYANFNISPTGKTPPSNQSFMAACSSSLVGQGIGSLDDFKSNFINNLTTTGNSGSQIVTKYAITTEDEYDYEQEYLYNSHHCYVMDRTIIPELNELDSNDGYFYFYNNNKKSGINPHENICTSVQISLEKNGNPNAINIQYSKDKINWTSYTIGAKLLLARNEIIYFRNRTNSNGLSQSTANYYTFVVDNDYKPDNTSQTTYNDYFTENNIISGNLDYNTYGYDIRVGGKISSLLGMAPNPEKTVQNYCFYNLFKDCKITNCKGINNDNLKSLHLDLSTISDYGYQRMFYNTPFLITGPVINATTVGEYSMAEMFRKSNVNKLATAYLYFGVASRGCCKEMFMESNFCDYLTITATTTNEGCFNSMFAITKKLRYNKISLNRIQNFAPSSCTKMFYGSVLYNFPKFYEGISSIGNAAFYEAFRGTKLNNINFVLAQTGSVGVEGCKYMFSGLSPQATCSLDGLKLSANTKYESCYYGMFQSAKRLTGTFWLPTYSISTSGCAYMFNEAEGVYCYSLWPTQLSNACYTHMFDHCKFRDIGGTNVGWHAYPGPKLPATSLTEDCYSYMFMGSNIDRHHDMYVPNAETLYQPTKYVLNATTLPKRCYYAMYQDSQLKYVSSIITSGLTAAGESSCGHMFQNTPIFIDNRARKIVRNDGVDMTFRLYYDYISNDTDFTTFLTKNGNTSCIHPGEDIFLSSNRIKVLTGFTASVNNEKTLFNGQVRFTNYTGQTTSLPSVYSIKLYETEYRFYDKTASIFNSEISIVSQDYKYTVEFDGKTYTADGQTLNEPMTDINKIYYIRCCDEHVLISSGDTAFKMVKGTSIGLSGTILGKFIGKYTSNGTDYYPFIWYPIKKMNIEDNSFIFDNDSLTFKGSSYAKYSYQEDEQNYQLPSWTNNYYLTDSSLGITYQKSGTYSLHYASGAEFVNLNATVLDDYCYEYMFSGCTNLYFGHNFKFGNLINLSDGCFSHMFDTCKNLRTITPDMNNFTSMGQYSCEYMYARCCSDDFGFRYVETDFNDWFWLIYPRVLGAIAIAFLAYGTLGIAAAELGYNTIGALLKAAASGVFDFFKGLFSPQTWGFSINIGLDSQSASILALGAIGAWSIYKVYDKWDNIIGYFSDFFYEDWSITLGELLGDFVVGLKFITYPDDIYTEYNTDQSWGPYNNYWENLYYTTNGLGYFVNVEKVRGFKEQKACEYVNPMITYKKDVPLWRTHGLSIKDYNDQSQYVFGTPLNNHCYEGMFEEVHSLILARITLPTQATLPISCYEKMFNRCTNLVTGPIIPENTTTVSEKSMKEMFKCCSSFLGQINNTHTLSAVNLASNCYDSMFYMCHSLSASPYLPSTIMAPECYKNMFYYAVDKGINYIAEVVFHKSGIVNDYKFFFFLCGDSHLVEFKYAQHNINYSSSDFGWRICDSSASTEESLSFTNFSVGEYVSKNKKWRAPDTLYFMTGQTVADDFRTSLQNLLIQYHLYFYDNFYETWHDFGSSNGYTVTIDISGGIMNADKFFEILSGYTIDSDISNSPYKCQQLSKIKANIPYSYLNSNYTFNWVEGIKESGIVGAGTVESTIGEYVGPGYQAPYGKSSIPSGWTRTPS